ncbi:hypothetical protein [Secundilactobacillus yichangensis]|uniref:hypothetical protein n=1 Tax=Secundilactobacillus yichangensis TaxID=2799580 RepID=UPI0019455781|nr:hypothetical protein [Secundilactobacillus yichangensis]
MSFQFNINEILNPKHELSQDEIQLLRNEFDEGVKESKFEQLNVSKTVHFSDNFEVEFSNSTQFSISSNEAFNETVHSFPLDFDEGLVA